MTAIRTCACTALLSRTNQSGKCKPCFLAHMNADPAIRSRRVRGIRRAMANQSPEAVERRRASGKRLYAAFLSRPDVVALNRSPEVRARAGKSITEAKLGWCPMGLRPHYRFLVHSLKIPAREARAIIEAEIPGTEQHTLRMIANRLDAKRIVDAREDLY